MSVFGPNQVEELIIGNAVAAEGAIPAFITSASDKEISCVGVSGEAFASGEAFKVLQKTSGNSTKGLNYEYSDIIKPTKVEKVIVAEHSAEVLKEVTVAGFTGNVVADTTYSVEIRLYNDGGSLSPENFVTISGYYVTGSDISGETVATIGQGIADSLNYNLAKRGGSEFTVTFDTDAITIGAQYQDVVPGKIIGRPIDFDVTAKQFVSGDLYQNDLFLLTVTVGTAGSPGVGTGKYAVNLEWFTKGYKYEVYRQTGYPADFNTPYYANKDGYYNAVHVKYFDSRISPAVERQPRVLTVLIEKAADDLASNAPTNTFLAQLRTILGTDAVPADLPVV